MNDPVNDLARLVPLCLSKNPTVQASTIKDLYDAKAVLDHPWLYVEGRDNILALFRQWVRCQLEIEMTVELVGKTDDPNTYVLHATEHIRPFWFFYAPSSFRLLIPVLVLVTLDSDGRRIIRQQDHFRLEPVLQLVPVLGQAYVHGRQVMGYLGVMTCLVMDAVITYLSLFCNIVGIGQGFKQT